MNFYRSQASSTNFENVSRENWRIKLYSTISAFTLGVCLVASKKSVRQKRDTSA